MDSDDTQVPDRFGGMFSGGVAGWYYGTWTGYYEFDKELIRSSPSEAPKGETAYPEYFSAMRRKRGDLTGHWKQTILDVINVLYIDGDSLVGGSVPILILI